MRYKIPCIDAPTMKLHENANFTSKWTGKYHLKRRNNHTCITALLCDCRFKNVHKNRGKNGVLVSFPFWLLMTGYFVIVKLTVFEDGVVWLTFCKLLLVSVPSITFCNQIKFNRVSNYFE